VGIDPDHVAQLARLAVVHALKARRSLVLLCHKSSFALALPQQGHCPRRAINM
jgi:hypothetical protein